MKALSTGLYCTLVFLICSSADSASLASAEFESILRATDCIKVANEKAFELRVLGRSFPVPQGYNFNGLFRGEAVFYADSDLDVLENASKYSDHTTMVAALEQWDKSTGSFQYYEMQPDDRNIEQRLKEFDALQWSGLTVYFRASAGEGWGKNSTTYQVIVHAEGYDEEIRITTASPQRIADIIACAEDPAENGDF